MTEKLKITRISSWRDLNDYGFDCLTGEACNLGLRLLVDMTDQGARTFRELMGLPHDSPLAQSYNSGPKDNRHWASAMMPRELWLPLAVLVLFKQGHPLIVRNALEEVIGIDGPYDQTEELLGNLRAIEKVDRIFVDRRKSDPHPHVGIDNIHTFAGVAHNERPAQAQDPLEQHEKLVDDISSAGSDETQTKVPDSFYDPDVD